MKANYIPFITRKFMLAATSALVVFSLMGLVKPQAAKAANGVPQPDHVVWVIFENHAYNQVIGTSAAPYFNSLVASGANMTFSHGVTHPSEPNYAAFFSGSTQGITGDPCPAPGATYSSPNLGAQLIAAGRTIKIYSEALPSVGYTGCSSGGYVYKHNPYVFWQGTGTNRLPSSGNVPWTAWPTDFNTLPTVSIVVPTLCNDMHDCSVATGDTWLRNNLDAYKVWAMTHNSLLIVDFDEDNMTSANVIPTIFVGQMVKPGNYGENINHYNVLRTIEDMYNLPYAGAAANVTTITDIWQPSGPTATPTRTATPCVSCPTNTPTRTPTATNTPPPAGANLVLNPSFETQGTGAANDAANWTEGALHARASDKFNTGSWALHSTFRTGGTDTRTTAAIAVSPNTTYNYSLYIWKTNSAGAAYADMNDIVGERTLMSSTTGNWQLLTGTWASGANTSVTLRLVTDSSPTGDIWFDDISLAVPGGPANTSTPTRTNTPAGPTNTNTPVPPTNTPTNTPVSSNLVLNPSFETSGTGGAADAADWTEGANHTRAADKFHTGAWSLKSTYTGTGTNTHTTVAIAVSPNHVYTYSGWIWRASTTGGSCMDMSDIVGETQLCTTTTGSWQFKSGTWNSGSNTSVTLRLITDGTPNNSIWFDDISLQ